MANAQTFIANNDQSSILDLLDIFLFEVEEWSTQAASEVERDGFELDDYESALPFEPVVETLLLVADVTLDSDRDTSDLRQLTIDLQHLRRKAKDWRDDTLRDDSIWWHWNTEGESEKRALIHRIEFSLPGGFMSVMKGDQIVLELTVIRHPHFEPLTAALETDGTEQASVHAYTMTLPALGDTNNRIVSTKILAGATYGADVADVTLWMGIRPTGAGTSGFISLWELEDGTVGTDTTAATVSGASGGDAMTVSFSTVETMDARVTINLGDVASSDLNHNKGRYLWLLGYKAEGAGVSYHLRLNQTYQQSAAKQTISEVYIDGAASPEWQVAALGVASIPFGVGRSELPSNDSALEYSGFEIEAARLNGSGGDDLHLDFLIPIPMHHFLKVEKADGSGTGSYTFVKTFEDDTHMGYATLGDVARFLHPSLASPINWSVPPEGGLLVAAGTGATGPAGPTRIWIQQIPRWALFNGD